MSTRPTNLSRKKAIIPLLLGLIVSLSIIYWAASEEYYIKSANGTYQWVDSNADQIKQTDEFIAIDCKGNCYSKKNYFDILSSLNLNNSFWFWIGVSVFMIMVRDAAYMVRIRVITNKALSWRQSFNVIMLWDFASAITPSIVGGATIAAFILQREKMSLGKSASLVLTTAFLDELFYVLMVPLVLLIVGGLSIFPTEFEATIFNCTIGAQDVFYIGYAIIIVFVVLLYIGLFVSPGLITKVLMLVARIPFLKKWSVKLISFSENMESTSADLKQKGVKFWAAAFAATCISWTARFWMVNFLIQAFSSLTISEHFLVYAKQLAMWVILLISPTPGGIGIAEFIFSGFLSALIPVGMAGTLAILWRLLSYYPYLIIGPLILPGWIAKTRR